MRGVSLRGSSRYVLVGLVAASLVGLSTLLRLVLWLQPGDPFAGSATDVAASFLVGAVFDVAAAAYVTAPLALYLLIVPDPVYRWKAHKAFAYGLLFFSFFLLCFNTVAEWLFWDEFATRFNFIAVDYLIYTTEVIGNIRQSYPVKWILGGEALVAALLVWLLRKPIGRALGEPSRLAQRLPVGLVLIALPFVAYALLDRSFRDRFESERLNELAGAGIYEFFAALRNKELDFRRHYANLPDDEAFRRVRAGLQTPDARLATEDPRGIERVVANAGPEKRWNVVLVSVESLSADFVGSLGSTEGLTPNLDRLSAQSLFFTRLYATGTRTVRGLEALTLSLPPTPGESIVKRPGNEGMFTIGHVFKEKGYDAKWVYGGYGYFDNMNAFYAASGYQVVDRTDMPSESIRHENIWGVSDEDLYERAIAEIDRSVAAGRPAFLHVMTTSNHRPYTYPEGRIDIASGSGRAGAVKYSDYAIGRFLEAARAKPWFDNTLFVITADHCARSSGQSELPVRGYHIPMWIYAPALVKPEKVERLMSQIDIAPTVLGMLNFSYRSRFFGYDLFRLEPGRERAFLGTYQTVGLLKNGEMAVLSPRRTVKTVAPEMNGGGATRVASDRALEEETMSWYQVASTAFRSGQLKVDVRGKQATSP